MMGEKWLKYLFLFCAALILGLMLLLTRRTGVTCDEVLHYNHSVSVYNYYASLGKDQSALNTPVTHLQYYGQSFDNLVTILTRWFNIEDIYGFRHIMSSIAGWLTIIITALFAVWIAGYGAGIIVLVLFAVSPTFLGHAQNNLKDIPFALGYIAGVYYMLKYLCSESVNSRKNSLLLTISIAFCISIRAGGLVLICYLLLFLFLSWLSKYLIERRINWHEIRRKMIAAIIISVISYFLSIVLWPYALQNPLLNPWRSYKVMLQFPDTFRQIFNGKVEWSDFMPWYYLPEYMAITIPVVVLSGLALFIIFANKIFNSGKAFIYWALSFTILFPLLFVILEKSNIYSAWRQFLFIYPGIILLASVGFLYLFQFIKNRYLSWALVALIAALSINPVKFMINNPEYSYIYYNQLVGGLKGAYGRFETDYYYVSLKEASEWLIKYLDTKKKEAPVKVRANFSVKWFFRNHPEIQNDYFRYEERSQYDWDYAIITNRYIPIYQLINRQWPPGNAIKVIYADNVPVCAILQRKSKDDFFAYKALESGRTKDALGYFEKALEYDDGDELFYYNFASALYDDGQFEKADSVLKKSLEINPDFDISLMYMGNIAAAEGKTEEAAAYYEKVIGVNRKYFEAYVELSKLIVKSDVKKARDLLCRCLNINSQFKPAIVALADTYRVSDPEIAKKYDELANKIKP
jgi:tetratricopeptide (TPR) repeat protein